MIYKVQPIKENKGEPIEISAFSFYNAAIAYASEYNQTNDYSLMDKNMQVLVERAGEKRIFNVSAKLNIKYDAVELKD